MMIIRTFNNICALIFQFDLALTAVICTQHLQKAYPYLVGGIKNIGSTCYQIAIVSFIELFGYCKGGIS